MNPEFGLGIDDFDESHVKRATIASSAEVAGLVIAENLGTALPYGLAPAKALTYLITDASADDAKRTPYRELGVTVVQA